MKNCSRTIVIFLLYNHLWSYLQVTSPVRTKIKVKLPPPWGLNFGATKERSNLIPGGRVRVEKHIKDELVVRPGCTKFVNLLAIIVRIIRDLHSRILYWNGLILRSRRFFFRVFCSCFVKKEAKRENDGGVGERAPAFNPGFNPHRRLSPPPVSYKDGFVSLLRNDPLITEK